MKSKLRIKPTLKDLTINDLKLLRKSYSLKENEWFCYGNCFERLFQLNLVTEDNKISYYGKQLVKHLAEF